MCMTVGMPRVFLALAAAVLLLPATPTGAKEGVRARLDNALPRHAAAGTVLRVGWTLKRGSESFSASGVYVELRTPSGRRVRKDGKLSGRLGHFVARIRAPRGGISRVRIGLRGWRQVAGGKRTRADIFFPIDGRTLR